MSERTMETCRPTPARAAFLPFSRPDLGEEEIAEVVDSLRSGWITTGPKVARFEDAFAAFAGTRHAVAVSSATAGLHIVLVSLGLKPGDEVVTTPLTWASTANTIVLAGARPVFADVDPATWQIDPASVAARITPRTRAILPVHFAGAPVDLDAIRALASEHGLAVLEDAAHAAGTAYRGRPIGAGSAAAVFSFHPIKNMTTGEGGMVTTDDEARAARLRLLRFHGVDKDAWKRAEGIGKAEYDILEPGFKYNMMDIQAALGLVQLRRLEAMNRVRARLAARYREALAGFPALRMQALPPYPHHHAWHLLIVRLDEALAGMDRAAFMERLAAENVGTGLHFPAVHLSRYYRETFGCRPGDAPVAEDLGARVVSLPLYTRMGDADVDDVVEAVRRVLA